MAENNGYHMENVYAEFLRKYLPKAQINTELKLLQTEVGNTLPDISVELPQADKTVVLDVTVSSLFPGKPPYPPKNKRDVLKIYEWLSKQDDNFGGLVIFQQNLLKPDHLMKTLPIIESLAYSRISTPLAQSMINLFANSYDYDLYRSDQMDWEIVANIIRKDLNL